MNIFLLELRTLRRGTVISTLAISVSIFVMLSFFPAMQNEAMRELAGVTLEGMNEAFLEAFGLSGTMDFTRMINFFGYVAQYVTLAVMIIITSRAAALFSKEEGDGTIEYIYSKPVSRTEIVLQKLLAHIALFAAMLIVCEVFTLAGYLAFADYSFGDALRETGIYYGGVFFSGLIFTAVGILISATAKRGGKTAGLAMGIVFGTFILGIMSAIVDELDFLVYASPMDWIKMQKLANEGFLIEEWIIGAAVIIICSVTALIIYKKKDLLIL